MLRLGDFLSRRGDPLQLEALTGDLGLDRPMTAAEVAGPGLALAGYTGRFAANRLHVLGETEITYLNSLPPDQRRQSLVTFFDFDLPCIFVTKGQDVPAELLELARNKGVPVLRSKLKTSEFYRRIKPIVEEAFAPRTTLHGSLADVYGVGFLFVMACHGLRKHRKRGAAPTAGRWCIRQVFTFSVGWVSAAPPTGISVRC